RAGRPAPQPAADGLQADTAAGGVGDQFGWAHRSVTCSALRAGWTGTSPPSPPSPPAGVTAGGDGGDGGGGLGPAAAPATTAHRNTPPCPPPTRSIIRPPKFRRAKCRNL